MPPVLKSYLSTAQATPAKVQTPELTIGGYDSAAMRRLITPQVQARQLEAPKTIMSEVLPPVSATAVQHFADSFAQASFQIADTDARLQATDQSTKTIQSLNRVLYGDPNDDNSPGALSYSGRSYVENHSAFMNMVDQIVQKDGEALDPAARAYYAKQVTDNLLQTKKTLAQHGVAQRNVWEEQSYNNMVATMREDITKDFRTPELFVDNVIAKCEQIKQLHPLDPEKGQMLADKFTVQAFKDVLELTGSTRDTGLVTMYTEYALKSGLDSDVVAKGLNTLHTIQVGNVDLELKRMQANEAKATLITKAQVRDILREPDEAQRIARAKATGNADTIIQINQHNDALRRGPAQSDPDVISMYKNHILDGGPLDTKSLYLNPRVVKKDADELVAMHDRLTDKNVQALVKEFDSFLQPMTKESTASRGPLGQKAQQAYIHTKGQFEETLAKAKKEGKSLEEAAFNFKSQLLNDPDFKVHRPGFSIPETAIYFVDMPSELDLTKQHSVYTDKMTDPNVRRSLVETNADEALYNIYEQFPKDAKGKPDMAYAWTPKGKALLENINRVQLQQRYYINLIEAQAAKAAKEALKPAEKPGLFQHLKDKIQNRPPQTPGADFKPTAFTDDAVGAAVANMNANSQKPSMSGDE